MKRQYLGDSKDSFKWDYLDFLVEALALPQLKIVWMMTPDDGGSDGKTSPERFLARPEVLRFCNSLKATRNPEKSWRNCQPLLGRTTRSPFTIHKST